jgi:hypothetical protein
MGQLGKGCPKKCLEIGRRGIGEATYQYVKYRDSTVIVLYVRSRLYKSESHRSQTPNCKITLVRHSSVSRKDGSIPLPTEVRPARLVAGSDGMVGTMGIVAAMGI